MDLNLQDKVALVTGGASGIGREIVLALLGEGCTVYVADLKPDAAKASGDFAGDARFISLDVGNAADAQEKIGAAAAEAGRIDILVNSAGILKTRPIVDSTIADWDDVARVNLSGVYYCIKAAIPSMIARKYGKIINLASVSSVKGGGAFGNILYGTTKAGVVAMSQGCARELAPYGINVNAISPGVVEGTPMTSGLMTQEVRDRIKANIPQGRLIKPSEIAKLALFLASDLSQAITGQAVIIDGGFTIR
jgi:NAD(P)-dependent dehydrogenase (short-subunit alcohol dehydrogenase family)